jgi:hypothetical protein
MLLESKAWSVRELAARVQAPKTTVHRPLTSDFGMIKRMAKWVPHTLTESQKEMREDTAYSNMTAFKNGKLDLDSIIAIDETWVPMYAPPPRHKAQFWLHPGEQAPNIPKP